MENKILPEKLLWTISGIGVIVGTIICFVAMDWGEWYADFDIEPVGLITGILTLALWLLPLAICLIFGGGIGAIVGLVVAMAIDVTVFWIVMFFIRKKEEFITRKTRKRASKLIKEVNKHIDEDIKRLQELKGKIINRDGAKSVYDLCQLMNRIVTNKAILEPCAQAAKEQLTLVKEADKIEAKILSLAKQYESVNDLKRAEYYYSLVQQR